MERAESLATGTQLFLFLEETKQKVEIINQTLHHHAKQTSAR